MPKAAKLVLTFKVKDRRVISVYPRHYWYDHRIIHDPPGDADAATGPPPRVASRLRARGPDLRDVRTMLNPIFRWRSMTGGHSQDIIPRSDIEVGATEDNVLHAATRAMFFWQR